MAIDGYFKLLWRKREFLKVVTPAIQFAIKVTVMPALLSFVC